MKSHALALVEQTQIQLEYNRLVSKLTEGLLLQARIDPNGIALICWLTDKPARSHRDALKNWVLVQIQSLDLKLGHQLIHPLSRQLSDLFARIQETE